MGAKIQAFDIFQTPLSSHYPLPLRDEIVDKIIKNSYKKRKFKLFLYISCKKISFPRMLSEHGLILSSTISEETFLFYIRIANICIK
jgi:hypothetical protein